MEKRIGKTREESPKEKTEEIKRVIGIDRGEKKIATFCVLGKNKNGEFLTPLEYYEYLGNLKKPDWKKHKSYFLDLAQFKIGRVNGKQQIIRWQEEDKNIELKKYEFITRCIKTIWIKNNREKIKDILEKFNKEKISDTEYVRGFINNLTHTDAEEKKNNIEDKIFNNHLMKTYQKDTLKDVSTLDKLSQIIMSFNEFDFNKKDVEEILKQQNLELKK